MCRDSRAVQVHKHRPLPVLLRTQTTFLRRPCYLSPTRRQNLSKGQLAVPEHRHHSTPLLQLTSMLWETDILCFLRQRRGKGSMERSDALLHEGHWPLDHRSCSTPGREQSRGCTCSIHVTSTTNTHHIHSLLAQVNLVFRIVEAILASNVDKDGATLNLRPELEAEQK